MYAGEGPSGLKPCNKGNVNHLIYLSLEAIFVHPSNYTLR